MHTSAPEPLWFTEWTPDQRRDYAQRFTRLAASGEDVDGEARLIDALLPRQARVLDAGCGVGRVAAALARAGHRSAGVDVDPTLIDAGRKQFPGQPLAVLDLWDIDAPSLAAAGLSDRYDLIVCAGNVMHYVAAGSQARIVARLAALLVPGGRAVFGFATGRDYSHDQLDLDAGNAGLSAEHRFGTWQADPFTAASDWAVSIYRAP